MADPVIVPPPPAITQPTTDDSPGMEQVQRAFDRVYPDKSPSKAQAAPAEAPPKSEPPPLVEPEPPSPPEKTTEKKEEQIPSFLEQALKLETAPDAKPAEPADSEWPEELPAFKTPEESKIRYKKWRESYNTLKKEAETLRSRPSRDPQEQERLTYLEGQNKQMAEVLSRVGVEQSGEFQQQIMQPLYASWNEAARIVRDSGADPQELAKAMTLGGRAQFEALDTLFADMPESAKAEAHDALRTYRRYESARQAAVANAPKTLEGIRARETERQYQEVSRQREDMKQMFDRAIATLRDEAKVEIFQKTAEAGGKWWNEQGDRIIEQGRNLFLENTDLEKVALACLLAPSADAYRNLFIKSQKKVTELQKIIDDKIGNEPVLSESGGNAGNLIPEQQMKEDLKAPFAQVFLREFHKSQSRNR